jgi:hypothetical protein
MCARIPHVLLNLHLLNGDASLFPFILLLKNIFFFIVKGYIEAPVIMKLLLK